MPQGSNGWRSSGTSWQHPNGDVPMLKWRHWSMARPPIDHIGWLYYVLLPGFRKIPTLTLRKPSPGHKAPLSRQHWASGHTGPLAPKSRPKTWPECKRARTHSATFYAMFVPLPRTSQCQGTMCRLCLSAFTWQKMLNYFHHLLIDSAAHDCWSVAVAVWRRLGSGVLGQKDRTILSLNWQTLWFVNSFQGICWLA